MNKKIICCNCGCKFDKICENHSYIKERKFDICRKSI